MSEKPMSNIGLDLQRIHRVITRGLSVLQENCPVFVKSGFPDDTTREGFWKYCQALEANTHGHHLTEDDIFFPFMKSRLPETDFRKLRAEHQVLAGILGEVKAAREAGSVADLKRALAKMASVWYTHIGKEQTWFSPEIMAQVMTVPEHIDMAQKAAAHSAAHAQPAPLSVPFLLYNVEAEDRAQFISVMPPELTQQLVPIVWKDEWAAMKPFLLP
jgi:hemerythrin-like domain-containing protein